MADRGRWPGTLPSPRSRCVSPPRPLADQLPSELRLLTLLDDPVHMRDLEHEVDWPLVTGLARHHRLTGQLATALQDRTSAREPLGTVATRLVRDQGRHRARYQHEVLPQLDELFRALDSVGVRPTLLKGAALVAMGVYAPGERQMADVDVLVDRTEIDATSTALTGLGYRPRVGTSARAWAREHHYQDPAWHHPVRPLPLEVHWDLQLPSHRLHFDPGSLRRIEIGLPTSTPARVLAPEELLTHLALHFWHDRAYGAEGALGQLWDVRRLSPASADPRWRTVRHRALLRGHARVLAAVLACSHVLLGGPVPVDFPEVGQLVRDQRCASFAIRRVLAQRPRHIQLLMVTPDVAYRPGRLARRVGAQLAKPGPLLSASYGDAPAWRLRVRHTRAILGLTGQLARSPIDTRAELELDRWAHDLA
jgi:hypothetical protein